MTARAPVPSQGRSRRGRPARQNRNVQSGVTGDPAHTVNASRRSARASAVEYAEGSLPRLVIHDQGLEREVALLRATINLLLSKRPLNVPLLFKTTEALAKIVAASHRLKKESAGGDPGRLIRNVMLEVGAPLGLFQTLLGDEWADGELPDRPEFDQYRKDHPAR